MIQSFSPLDHHDAFFIFEYFFESEIAMPGRIEHDNQRLPATYVNFYFINGALLVPTYGNKSLDRRALGGATSQSRKSERRDRRSCTAYGRCHARPTGVHLKSTVESVKVLCGPTRNCDAA